MNRQTPRRDDSTRPNPAKGLTRKQRKEAKRQRELEREKIQQEQIEEKNRRRKALIEECIQKGNEAAGALNRIEEIERIDEYIYEAKSAEKAFRNNNLARIEFQKRNYHNSLKLFKSVIIFANKVIEANEAKFSVPGNQLGTPSPPKRKKRMPRSPSSPTAFELSSALGQPSVW